MILDDMAGWSGQGSSSGPGHPAALRLSTPTQLPTTNHPLFSVIEQELPAAEDRPEEVLDSAAELRLRRLVQDRQQV